MNARLLDVARESLAKMDGAERERIRGQMLSSQWLSYFKPTDDDDPHRLAFLSDARAEILTALAELDCDAIEAIDATSDTHAECMSPAKLLSSGILGGRVPPGMPGGPKSRLTFTEGGGRVSVKLGKYGCYWVLRPDGPVTSAAAMVQSLIRRAKGR